MRLVQFFQENDPSVTCVGRVSEDGQTLQVLEGVASTYHLAQEAVDAGQGLADLVSGKDIAAIVDYSSVVEAGRLLSPVTHPDPAHMLVAGTGLTHLGSASTRSAMHEKSDAEMTDSMKMFKWGVEGGRPAAGQVGCEPEWFFKGDGSWIVPPGAALELPEFALDGGEEPEIVGIYFIGEDSIPYRIGYSIANEFSDHVLEKRNYLLLAHSKLRTSSFGPELLIGDLPSSVRGTSRILRKDKTVWEKEFFSGEDHMSHSLANLEHHHFKYTGFRRPGDVHVHFFGTSTLSFADQFKAEPGDIFEIAAEGFGRALQNQLKVVKTPSNGVRPL